MHPEWASRFYGIVVDPDVAAAAHEGLTDPAIDDLVDAHLAINYAYFGAIDKTLSGFVVLESTGDDYTLLDLRDGGQVWWQSHDTRALELRHASLADYLAKHEDVALAARGTREVSSVALCARYQWLVWFLARPLEQHGKPVQEIEYLVRGGIGRLRHSWPSRTALDAAFAHELTLLRGDPHLAIYWLLHTTAFADPERRRRVIEAMEPSCELARAFVARLGELPLAGDVPVVPGFRARRAFAQTYGETELVAEEIPRACLVALELDPWTGSLVHALQVTSGMDRGLLAPAEVATVVARITDVAPGTQLVRAVLVRRGGATASPHADQLARLIPGGADPWWFQLEALWQVHELAYDGAALVAATRTIVARDRYHRRALQMAMRAAQIANEPEAVIDTIERELAIADQVIDPFQKLVEAPQQWQATIGMLPLPMARRALAWRVLQRVALNKPSAELAAWAAQQVITSDEGAVLVGEAFAAMDAETQGGVVAAMAEAIDREDHPLVATLLACLDGPEPPPTDFAAEMTMKKTKGAALIALARWLHAPAMFEKLMPIVERPASGALVDLFWGKLFSPFEKASHVVPRLTPAQVVRVGKALIATVLRHPDIHGRNAAGHALARFAPPAAEAVLVDALTEYGVRFAAAKGPGGAVLDHGKTEHDQLEDLVANLYAAVARLKTPGSREALVERLFAERRAYWRLGNAIAQIWSPEVHAQVLARLAERRDARAAGAYAYALQDFVKQGAPLLDLARLVREWQGDTELARGFLHYALVVGIAAALAAGDHELVRLAHENAAWIAEPPLEPDAFTRGLAWTNPLETEDGARALAAALGPVAPAQPPPATPPVATMPGAPALGVVKQPAATKPATTDPAGTPAAKESAGAKKAAGAKQPAATKKPAAKRPVAEKPAAKKPAAKQPAVAKKPVAKKPVVKKPMAKKPAAKKPAKAATKKSAVKPKPAKPAKGRAKRAAGPRR